MTRRRRPPEPSAEPARQPTARERALRLGWGGEDTARHLVERGLASPGFLDWCREAHPEWTVSA